MYDDTDTVAAPDLPEFNLGSEEDLARHRPHLRDMAFTGRIHLADGRHYLYDAVTDELKLEGWTLLATTCVYYSTPAEAEPPSRSTHWQYASLLKGMPGCANPDVPSMICPYGGSPACPVSRHEAQLVARCRADNGDDHGLMQSRSGPGALTYCWYVVNDHIVQAWLGPDALIDAQAHFETVTEGMAPVEIIHESPSYIKELLEA